MQSPGIEIEHEVITHFLFSRVSCLMEENVTDERVSIDEQVAKCRMARLTSLEDHVGKLLLLRKADYNLQSARAEAEVARERTRLASGESGSFESGAMVSLGGGGGSGY